MRKLAKRATAILLAMLMTVEVFPAPVEVYADEPAPVTDTVVQEDNADIVKEAEIDKKEPEVMEPATAEPETTEPKAAEGTVTEPETTEPETAESKAAEGTVTEPETTEQEATVEKAENAGDASSEEPEGIETAGSMRITGTK